MAARGSLVTYYLPRGPSKGQPRAALVIDYHTPGVAADLYVFGNPRTDGAEFGGVTFVSSAAFATTKAPGTWQ